MNPNPARRPYLIGSCLGLAYGLAFLMSFDGAQLAPSAIAQNKGDAAKWGLVEVKFDQKVYKRDRNGKNSYDEVKYAPAGYKWDLVQNDGDGKLRFEFHHTWTYDAPPGELKAGHKFTLKVHGTANDTKPEKSLTSSWGGYTANGISIKTGRILVDGKEYPNAEFPNWKWATIGNIVSGPKDPVRASSANFDFEVSEGTTDEFTIRLFGASLTAPYDGFATYRYKRGAVSIVTPPQPPAQINARLECGLVTLKPGFLPSEVCGLYISGWRSNTLDQVEVVFPGQTSLWGDVDKGIVVFPGTTNIDPDSMVRDEYYLPLFWRARCSAPFGPSKVDIIVRQNLAGSVTLTQNVSVVPPVSQNCNVGDPEPVGLSGTFATSFGKVTLTNNGKQATGTYTKNNGTLTGTVNKGIFVGTWADATGSGKITLFLTPGGKSLAGEWIRVKGGGDRSGHVDGTTGEPPGVTDTLKTGRWVCYYPVKFKEGPDDPDRKNRPACRVFYDGAELKLKNENGEVANASVVSEGGVRKVIATKGWPAVNLKGIIKDSGKRIDWQGLGDAGVWVYREKTAPDDSMILLAPDLIVPRGALVTVPIKLRNAKDVTNLDFLCNYSPDVVSARPAAEKGSLVSEIWEFKLSKPGLFKFNFAQLALIKGSGTVAGFRFDAIGPGRSKTPLTLTVHTVNNAKGDKLPIKIINGSITIYDGKDPTDPNNPNNGGGPGGGGMQPTCSGLGRQTVADAQCCLKMWVGLSPLGMHMDVNGDGKVDSADALRILQNVAKELEK